MLELATVLISNGFVVGLLIYSIKRSGKQEQALSQHIINFTRETTERPTFPERDKRIEKAVKPACKKTSDLTKDFRQHRHESKHGRIVLGV